MTPRLLNQSSQLSDFADRDFVDRDFVDRLMRRDTSTKLCKLKRRDAKQYKACWNAGTGIQKDEISMRTVLQSEALSARLIPFSSGFDEGFD